MPSPTKPTTIQGRWDQYCVEFMPVEGDPRWIMIFKHAFISGFGNGLDVLDDRLGEPRADLAYCQVLGQAVKEVFEEFDKWKELYKRHNREVGS